VRPCAVVSWGERRFIHELKTAAYSKESPPTAPAATAEEMAQAMAAGKRRSRKH